ncbi:follicle cell protein 3C-1 [Drosophila eugracilis]|uniref:follicle cell protein 3C-1 n=1 Tax=Drosophila eugracilis TaxID=29029 RepID=UPI0007E7FE4D|nr:follicle cell protein 3C-1 [Drosophila eugracilis]
MEILAVFKNSLLLLTLLLAIHLEASKIVYKKPLYGNGNTIKDKWSKMKGIVKPEVSTMSSTTTTEEDWPTAVEFVIVTTPRSDLETESKLINDDGDDSIIITTTTESNVAKATEISIKSVESSTIPVATTTSSSSLANTIPLPPTPSVLSQQENQPVPCTCGVFLSSQISNGLPTKPLIHQELDRMFPCNAIGSKQCQTKCLETIVQHLPNSANIVCSALGHDCHKERAYLFIKNCHNQWVNTNLQAGREYCCRSGVPYRCPLMG